MSDFKKGFKKGYKKTGQFAADKRSSGSFKPKYGSKTGPSYGPRKSGITTAKFGRFERAVMHRATCSVCGQNTEVPFKPDNSRPIFCNNCYEGKDGKGKKPSMGAGRFAPQASEEFESLKRQVESLAYKVERLASLLEAGMTARAGEPTEGAGDASVAAFRPSFTPKKFSKSGLKPKKGGKKGKKK